MQKITITFASVKHDYINLGAKNRVIYHAGTDKTIIKQQFSLETNEVVVNMYKRNAVPVLSCIDFDFTFDMAKVSPAEAVLGEGSMFCPFAMGSVYPDFASDLYNLHLSPHKNAQLARTLLVFFNRGGNINIINVKKMMTVIEKKEIPFFLDTGRFLQDISRNKLSVYSITARELLDIVINDDKDETTWISASVYQFKQNKNTIRVPRGTWLFIEQKTDHNRQTNKYASMRVLTAKTFLFKEHR